MSLRYCLVYWCLMLLFVEALQGQQARVDDTQAFVNACQSIEKTLDVRTKFLKASRNVPLEEDDFTAAGQACNRLNNAISISDPAKTRLAVAALRAALARLGLPPSSPKEQLAALEEATKGATGDNIFYSLADLAKRAFNAGEAEKASVYSKRLLEMAPKYTKDWNYGNAIYYGNFVLGRIAVNKDNLAQAGEYLLAAGGTPGSPQLDSFGPNMSLAKELLEKNQSDVVLHYLGLCKTFWKMDRGKLDQWSATIRRGEIPDFGSNLDY